jgi:microcin C transport system permease protein
MGTYLLKRLLLIFPTLLGIMVISFAIVQFAPGGPIERIIAQVSGTDVSATARFGGGSGEGLSPTGAQTGLDQASSKYRGAQGLDPEFIKELEREFGFDKPAHERFFKMMKNYLMFDFGTSYFKKTSVIELI